MDSGIWLWVRKVLGTPRHLSEDGYLPPCGHDVWSRNFFPSWATHLQCSLLTIHYEFTHEFLEIFWLFSSHTFFKSFFDKLPYAFSQVFAKINVLWIWKKGLPKHMIIHLYGNICNFKSIGFKIKKNPSILFENSHWVYSYKHPWLC